MQKILTWLVVLSLTISSVGVVQAGDDPPRVHPALLQLAADHPDETFMVIIQREVKNKDLKDDDPETAVIKAGGKVKKQLAMIESFSAELTGKEIEKLAKQKKVRWISLDAPLMSTQLSSETVRDEFTTLSFGNNDGTANWLAGWVENDPESGGDGPAVGQVQISGGELRLDDSPDTGGYPSAARAVDIAGGATSATLTFDYHTSAGVDSDDAVAVEVSGDGGVNYATLETFTNISGVNTGSRNYDISGFISANTMVRFRVTNLYGGSDEYFYVDHVQIAHNGGNSNDTVRDEFTLLSLGNNDGTANWMSSWAENDPESGGNGPAVGQVQISGGELRLDDTPDTGGHPSAARAVDLAGGATSATLTFDYHTSTGVDSDDAVAVEVSGDGGVNYATLETFINISGVSTGSRNYDISGFISANTLVRFRVTNLYGGSNEYFYVDNVQVEYSGSGIDSTPQSDPQAGGTVPETVTLIAENQVWHYLDNGSDQGTAWQSSEFDHSSWATGAAQLGYGDGDEATVVGYGSSSSNKYVTTYFRHPFYVSNADSFTSLAMRLLRDDGAVVYLNGTEVYRSNMPSGTIAYNTYASSASEHTHYITGIDPALLVNGENILAVEIHQANASSSDISFNLELTGDTNCAACIDVSHLTNTYVEVVGSDQLWNEPTPVNGEDIVVAVVDSGISDHEDFIDPSTGNSRLVAAVNFSNDPDTDDENGHGTHVAGIIAGNGSSSHGARIGIAPKAKLVNVKVTNKDGMGYVSDVVAGLQWIYDNKDLYNIRIVNISVNSAFAESYHVSPLSAAVEILWFNGIVVVVAAGNNGTGSAPVTLYPPANDPFAITVGATNDMVTSDLSDDTVEYFSAYGTTEEGFAKPDLVAPGRNIISLLASILAKIFGAHPSYQVDETHFRMSGTSMTAPIVSGAAALLLQDEPTLTPDQVKYRLVTTANSTWPGYDAAKAGAGYVNAAAAVHGTTTEKANTGIAASQLLWTGIDPIAWDSVSWNSVSWNSVSWNSVSWNSVSWNSVSWNSETWTCGVWDDELVNASHVNAIAVDEQNEVGNANDTAAAVNQELNNRIFLPVISSIWDDAPVNVSDVNAIATDKQNDTDNTNDTAAPVDEELNNQIFLPVVTR